LNSPSQLGEICVLRALAKRPLSRTFSHIFPKILVKNTVAEGQKKIFFLVKPGHFFDQFWFCFGPGGAQKLPVIVPLSCQNCPQLMQKCRSCANLGVVDYICQKFFFARSAREIFARFPPLNPLFFTRAKRAVRKNRLFFR